MDAQAEGQMRENFSTNVIWIDEAPFHPGAIVLVNGKLDDACCFLLVLSSLVFGQKADARAGFVGNDQKVKDDLLPCQGGRRGIVDRRVLVLADQLSPQLS